MGDTRDGTALAAEPAAVDAENMAVDAGTWLLAQRSKNGAASQVRCNRRGDMALYSRIVSDGSKDLEAQQGNRSCPQAGTAGNSTKQNKTQDSRLP